MVPEAVEQWMKICREIDLQLTVDLARWYDNGQQGPKPQRRKLTPEERKIRRKYSTWWRKSWFIAGDAPSPGHMKKRYSR